MINVGILQVALLLGGRQLLHAYVERGAAPDVMQVHPVEAVVGRQRLEHERDGLRVCKMQQHKSVRVSGDWKLQLE